MRVKMNATLESGPESGEKPLKIVFSVIILWLPANSYVLWLILCGAGGGTIASEFFSLNLTVSGIISSLASIFYFVWIFTREAACDTVVFVVGILLLYSFPSFQCCICVERYVAVVRPVAYLRYKALRYRLACSCAVWLMVLALICGYVVGGLSTAVSSYIFLGFYATLISAMSFCCLAVLRALKRPGPGEVRPRSGGQEGSHQNVKRGAFKNILIILIAMLIGYIPYVLTVAMRHFLNPETFHTSVAVTYSLAMVLGLVQPFLHMHRVGKLPCFKKL